MLIELSLTERLFFLGYGCGGSLICLFMGKEARSFRRNKQYVEATYEGEITYQYSKILTCRLYPNDKTPVEIDTAFPDLLKEQYKVGDTIGVYYDPKSKFKTVCPVEYPSKYPKLYVSTMIVAYIFIFIALRGGI